MLGWGVSKLRLFRRIGKGGKGLEGGWCFEKNEEL